VKKVIAFFKSWREWWIGIPIVLGIIALSMIVNAIFGPQGFDW